MRVDEICLVVKHKFSQQNVDFNRAPDQATIHEVTGHVESDAYKFCNLNRSFARLAIGVRNMLFSPVQRINEHNIFVLGSLVHTELPTSNGN